jgi:hypothetical protein
MTGENLYPNLVIKSEEETKEMIDNILNDSRVKEMMNQRDILIKDLERYEKLKKR